MIVIIVITIIFIHTGLMKAKDYKVPYKNSKHLLFKRQNIKIVEA